MLRRHMQKLLGPPKIPSPEGSSDEETEPHCSYATRKENTYEGLEVQTSDSEVEDSSGSSNVSDTEDKNEAKAPKNVKKNKQKQAKSANVDDANIDQIVREVDAMLGAPAPVKPPARESVKDTFESVFSVRKKYLNPTEEFESLFGLEETEGNRRKNRGRNSNKFMLRNQITPVTTGLKCKGLSMSVVEVKDGVTYFVYNHNQQYQQQHKALIQYLQGKRGSHYQEVDETPVTKAFHNMHVEGMLEGFKYYCEAEEYDLANKTLEQVIAYLQFVADPLFNITNGMTRLEYKYVENRAFFIAVLQYSYFVSNRACHRSALELVKMLLTLDPSDPLALVFVLDTFAVHAREFEWLVRAVDVLNRERDVRRLINIQFSYALSLFHVATARQEDTQRATELLEEAMLFFPTTPRALISNMGLSSLDPRTEKIRTHSYFNEYAQATTPKPLKEAIELYAALIGPRWKESPVFEWLLQTADRMCNVSAHTLQLPRGLKGRRRTLERGDDAGVAAADGAPAVRRDRRHVPLVKMYERARRDMYAHCPSEIFRHLCVLKPMASFILEQTDVPVNVYSEVTSFDPTPSVSKTINRYGYHTRLCYK